MLYFYYGTDSARARKKARATVSSLLVKKPDASYIEMTGETFSRASFDEAVSGGHGLFSSKILTFLDGVFDNEDAGKIVVSYLKEISESENIFILADGVLSVVIKKKLLGSAKHSQEFSLLNSKDKTISIGFAVGDALCLRDRKKAWVLFERAVRSGLSSEEIAGALFWQIKNIFIIKIAGGKAAEQSGLRGFPLSKALRYEKNFSKEEIKLLSSRLVSIYHKARQKDGDNLKISLEKFILS